MFFVRSRVSGKWSVIDTYDFRGDKDGEKLLIQVIEDAGRWCIDGRPVDVQKGVCVSFRNHGDAQWFVDNRRAQYVAVEPEMAVVFELESDAQWVVRQGLAELMSQREVEALFASHTQHADAPQAEPEPEPTVKTEANVKTRGKVGKTKKAV